MRSVAETVPEMEPGESIPALAVKTAEFAERREFVRQSMLRANRAVAVILGVVVLLGAAMVYAGFRSSRNQARAEQAETEATERLWKASLAQARAENLSTQMGHREAALEAVRTAAAIRPSPELRNEAIAALGQRDFVVEKNWNSRPNPYGFGFDPDLKYYVARYDPKVLSLYRMEDDTHVRDFPLPLFLHLRQGVNVGDFQFSGSGKYVFVRYNGGPFTIFETETGKGVRMIGMDPRAQRWSWPPTCTADDRLLCMNMAGTGGESVLYDIEKGELRELPQWPTDFKWSGGSSQVAVSPRGDLVAWFSGADISVLDAVTGAVVKTMKAPAAVSAFRWDEQGGRLSFYSENFAVSIWDLKSDRVVQMGSTSINVWLQKFSPDGRMLLTAGTDGITRLWDIATARLICQTNSARGLEFNRAGDRVAWGIQGKGTGTWRIAQPAGTRYFVGTFLERVLVWQHDISQDGALALWTPSRWSPQFGFDLLDLNGGGLFNHTSARKMTMGFVPARERQVWMIESGSMKVADLPSGASGALPQNVDWMQQAQNVPLPAGFGANAASWSADGRRVAVAGANSGLLVMDTTVPEKPVMLERGYSSHDSIQGPGSSTGSGAMSLSPDGRWVAAGRYTNGYLTVIWDALTGKIVKRLPELIHSHVTFSPDGRWLFVAGTNGAALWSTETWQRRWRILRPAMLDMQSSGCFTGDSSLIAWTSGVTRVDLMDMDGRSVGTLDFPELGYIAGLRFAVGGSKLFATGMEARMLTVDIPALRSELAELKIDWSAPLPADPPGTAPAARTGLSAWSPALLGIVPVILAGVLGVIVLRRQRRLTGEFVETTELAARRTQELAAEREVGELKSRFVTTVSHEFRTPLGITMSAVELLRHYEARLPPEEKKQLFDDIHTATKNMAGLMEQVLVLGRVDAGKLAYKPAPLDLDALARKLADESLSATNRKCPIEWSAENDLSGAHADEALLRHILANLLSNGVKYSPAGTPVHFSARREGPMAVFTVQDSGIGIPDKDLPHLFEAFHRGSNVGDIPGTGLGLVIIKRCAELHRGSIQVKSTPGAGTTFTVRIPAW